MGRGDSSANAARARLIAWLGELGPRWGLPADACRVHGHLYLAAMPASESELADSLAMEESAVREALAWLEEQRLVEPIPPSGWATGSDPWELVTRALEQRRARELSPALDLLRASRAEAAAEPVLARQIGRLLDLVEDIAAIDAQAHRLSPAALRTLIGVGGRVSRFLGGRR
jgi:DNA-binding transcriptional regulator GbsR (MarR family)